MKNASDHIARFYLYGEPQREVSEHFVHIERLEYRSRPNRWTIRPHTHAGLHHIILMTDGGGRMSVEGRSMSFNAPCLLLIPARQVHSFQWHEESGGWVITLADPIFADISVRHREFAALFRDAACIALEPSVAVEASARAELLAQELDWKSPGQSAAIELTLLSMLLIALRSGNEQEIEAPQSCTHARLVARLRERIERGFRERQSIAHHAKALGVSQTALRAASAKVAGISPSLMLDERSILEARRLLLYTHLSISEIAFDLGFADPAYFSRFFSRHCGTSPREYRLQKRTGGLVTLSVQ